MGRSGNPSKRTDDVRGETMGRFLAASEDPANVLVDASRAVHLENLEVAAVKGYSNLTNKTQRGEPEERDLIAMTLEGRVNRSREHAKVLWLFDADGAAAIISELLALASRMGEDFSHLLMARMEKLERDGHMGPQADPQPVDEANPELVESNPVQRT